MIRHVAKTGVKGSKHTEPQRRAEGYARATLYGRKQRKRRVGGKCAPHRHQDKRRLRRRKQRKQSRARV